MRSVVIYASRSGNTEKVAMAIAEALRARGAAELILVADAPAEFAVDVDLVVVGGPTEGHGMTEAVTGFFDALPPDSLRGRAAAGFDTRVTWPRWASGSAAVGIVKRLEKAGARVIVPAESFMVSTKPLLEPGELERATAWGASLGDRVARLDTPEPVTVR